LNRTKIDWTDYTWNPITGCLHGCWYCYARKIAIRFPKRFPLGFRPTFHPERLHEPEIHKKPSKIFCCSIADIFAEWTPDEWIDQVLVAMETCPVPHIFQMLTKNPENIPEDYVFDKRIWVGTTVTGENAPDRDDWKNISEIKKVHAGIRFVSFEPLLGLLPFNVCLEGIDWIIIGKLTGSRRIPLDPNWVNVILWEADDHNIPIFMKNNLLPDWTGPMRREWPRLSEEPPIPHPPAKASERQEAP